MSGESEKGVRSECGLSCFIEQVIWREYSPCLHFIGLSCFRAVNFGGSTLFACISLVCLAKRAVNLAGILSLLAFHWSVML